MIVLSIIVIAVALSAAILSICASKQDKRATSREAKIDSIIIVKGHRLHVVDDEGNPCKGCYFFPQCKWGEEDMGRVIDIVGPCTAMVRRDKKNVKFIEMR